MNTILKPLYLSRYTALGMALALQPGGRLIACDITDEYPAIGACLCPSSCPHSILSAPVRIKHGQHRFHHPSPVVHNRLTASLDALCAGKPYWEEAGVADKIDLRIAPAVDTLDELLKVRKSHSCVSVPYPSLHIHILEHRKQTVNAKQPRAMGMCGLAVYIRKGLAQQTVIFGQLYLAMANSLVRQCRRMARVL